MRFENNFILGDPDFMKTPDLDTIRFGTQFWRADIDFVYKHGKDLGKQLVDGLLHTHFNDGYKYISIDSRVHMLMPGMYPCIPGWHCDDFHRPDGQQPDLANVPDCKHAAIVLDLGTNSLTEFLGTVELPDPDSLKASNDRPLYGLYDKIINELQEKPLVHQVRSGGLVLFGPKHFHRGQPATARGWRMFIRATASNHRTPMNEVRTQTQVYLTDPFHGW